MQAANATVQVQIAEIDRRIRCDTKRRRELICVLYGLPGAKRSKKTAVGTRKKKQLESLPTDMIEAIVDRLGCHASYKRLHLVCKAASRMVATAGHVGVLWVGGVDERWKSIEHLKKQFEWVELTERYKYNGVSFAEGFNQPVDKLPAGLTHLELDSGSNFNQPVDKLPARLIELGLGGDNIGRFNQPVDKLPAGLKHLTLGTNFDQPVDKLPAGLTYLELHNDSFNQPVDKLPVGVTCWDPRILWAPRDMNYLDTIKNWRSERMHVVNILHPTP